MLAVAYCYLVSGYAKLTLHTGTLLSTDNVGWHTTASFIFSTVFGIWPIIEMHKDMWPGYILFSFS